jgi:hypothetical protein
MLRTKKITKRVILNAFFVAGIAIAIVSMFLMLLCMGYPYIATYLDPASRYFGASLGLGFLMIFAPFFD